ncbi:hypothetical protein F8S09_15775 [Deinococcus sp. SDU3-2]|uniref:Uncharacterized protein n=1 Tax=Deinococcus terrestris TaxID=2651870 RepID=A0A7X1NYG1_9DEIO|nr:hypothetical protein [Deinococcus terrestris]MPY68116.1 hypothetical protein [Deinococcus terrestris]
MNDLKLQELDEGDRQDFALAASRSRCCPAGVESEHPVVHLLQHPEVRPEPEDERSAETTSRA